MQAERADSATSGSAGTEEAFAGIVIAWQARAGRHHLPWQGSRDPYRIWLSEIMLQQTQVAAVIPYYERFLNRFPSLAELAAAPLEAVLALWSGLGYYSRARNLHRCAIELMTRHGGAFPTDPEALATLPGIGRSTAAAIAAFAFGRRAAILDGNVKRVLCRVFAIEGFPGERRVEQALWSLADRLLPAQGIEPYTQGLMDLGASICTRSRPACDRCPLSTRCEALRLERVAELPTPRPRRIARHRVAALLVIRCAGRVLLTERPARGIWGGLWSLPEQELSALAATTPFTRPVTAVPSAPSVTPAASSTRPEPGPGGPDEEAARVVAAGTQLCAALSIDGSRLAAPRPLPAFEHAFTHYTLRARPWLFELAAADRSGLSTANAASLPAGWRWADPEDRAHAALPRPVKTLLGALPPS